MAKIKSFFKKIKEWFINHKPTKRRIIQVYAALLTNANLKGFATGAIYKGLTKNVCVPGLNCYSCPGAIGSCPLGSLQNALAATNTRLPDYIFGIIILFGLSLGRTICGFLCPIGLGQELLYKIKTPKLRKSRVTRVLSYFKYVVLIMTIAIPLIYQGIPFFCEYICPAGTAEGAIGLLSSIENSGFFGMLGYLFTWKFLLLVIIIVASIFIFRSFCRFLCPLGAIYGFFSKVALLGIKLDESACIHCGKCISACKVDIKKVGDHECVNCGDCISVCPTNAISWKGSKIFLHPSTISTVNENAVDIKSMAKTVEQSQDSTQSEQSVCEQVKPVIKTPLWQKVVKIVSVVLAVLLLGTALVYYNCIDGRTGSVKDGVEIGERLIDFKGVVYGKNKTFALRNDLGEKATVILFWNGDIDGENQVKTVVDVNNELSTISQNYKQNTVVYALYPSGSKIAESCIQNNSWQDEITFVSYDSDNEIIGRLYNQKDKPLTVVVDGNGVIVAKSVGLLDNAQLKSQLKTPYCGYNVGDFVKDFELKLYKTASDKYVDETSMFSTKDCLGKVLVINYWYTTCTPCVKELDGYFEKVFDDYSDKINMVAIHSKDITEVVQAFLDRKGWSDYNMMIAQDTANVNSYESLGGKGAFPMTIIVNKDGVITCVNHGEIDEDILRQRIEDSLI